MSTSILLRAIPLLLALGLATSAPAAVIRIINMDGVDEGFNDPTPVAPVAGNPGTTLGAQRMFVFQMAANQWGSLLASPVEIQVQAAFNPLECSSAGSVLGSAGPLSSHANFTGAPYPGTLYPAALANSLAGRDLASSVRDINVQFNPYTSAACSSAGIRWWYGVNPPAPTPTATDRVQSLFPVTLHELAHGLGFTAGMDTAGGVYAMNTPPIWARFLYDLTQNKTWLEMEGEPFPSAVTGEAERSASAINDGNLVWFGAYVSDHLDSFLGYTNIVRTYPVEDFPAEAASFGPAPPYPVGLTRNVVLVNDGSTVVPPPIPMPPTPGTLSDGCNAPFANAAQISGNIALLDRGQCSFALKVRNAQNAGAVGVLVANGDTTPMVYAMPGDGINDSAVIIPAYMISYSLGNSLKTRLETEMVAATMRYGNTLAGTNSGYVQMFAPDPFEGGSSVSHFTKAAVPNLLMEPAATNVFNTVDLTTYLFQDIGWALNTPTANAAPSVNTPVISGVEDTLNLLTGVSFSDSDAGTLPLMMTFEGGGMDITPAAPGGAIPGVTISGLTSNKTWMGSAAALNTAVNNGWIGYTPPANFNGTARIGIQVHDMGASGTGGNRSYSGTLTFNIAAVNDAPVAVNDSLGASNEDEPRSIPSATLVANDTDVDGVTTLSVTGLSEGPGVNSVTMDMSGNVQVTLIPHFNGVASFTYRTSDGVATSAETATVSFNITPVNDAPVAVDDSLADSEEDQAFLVPIATLLANDTDPDAGAVLTLTELTAGAGIVSLSIEGSDIRVTPVPNFNGPARFTYRASDGRLPSVATASVSFTVKSDNDAPVARDDSLDTPSNEDDVRTIPIATLLANDTDPDTGAVLSIAEVGPGVGVSSVSIVSGSVRIVPIRNFYGTANFIYRANDGFVSSADATVSFTITPVNDPPVAVNDSLPASNEDDVRFIPIASLVGNDTDVDSTTGLTVTGLTAVAGISSVTIDMVGNVVMTPVRNFYGDASFTYRTSDGAATSVETATVSFTIRPVNDPPVAVNDLLPASDEDDVRFIPIASLVGNDTDVDSTTGLTVTGLTAGAGVSSVTITMDGSNVQMTPVRNFYGDASFTYRTSDGAATSAGIATVNFTIRALNDAPVAVNDSFGTPSDEDTVRSIPIATLVSNDTDADGTTGLTVSALTAGAGVASVTIDMASNVLVTPIRNFNGPASFTYRTSDGVATSAAPATVSFNIRPVNDPPTAVNDSLSESIEDVVRLVPIASLLANDSDVDGASTLSLTGLTAGVGVSSVTITMDGSNVQMTPIANFNGPASFSYRANDGLLSSAGATVNFTITPVNDAPVAANDSLLASNEDAVRVIPVASLIANDTDVDSTTRLTVTGLTAGAGVSSVTVDMVGDVVMTPIPNFNGAANFSYSVNDGVVNSAAPAVVNFTISPVNDAPVVTSPSSLTARNPGLTAITGISFADLDALTGTVSVTYTTTAGVLQATSAGGVTVTGSGTASLALSGSLSNINAFTAGASGVSLNLTTAVTGAQSITVTLSDGGNTGSGGVQARSVTVPLSLLAGTDPIFANSFE